MITDGADSTVEELTVVSSLADRERGVVKIDDGDSCTKEGEIHSGLSIGDKSLILSSEVRLTSILRRLGLIILFLIEFE